MKLSIGETAKLLGVSLRALRYYDEIGLVKPSQVSEAGYRFYDERALDALQRTLFYRELGFARAAATAPPPRGSRCFWKPSATAWKKSAWTQKRSAATTPTCASA